MIYLEIEHFSFSEFKNYPIGWISSTLGKLILFKNFTSKSLKSVEATVIDI